METLSLPISSRGWISPCLWWVTSFSFVKINCESWGSVSIERGVPFRSLINKSYFQGHYIPWFQRATKMSPGLSLSTDCAGFFLKNNDSFKSFPNNIKKTHVQANTIKHLPMFFLPHTFFESQRKPPACLLSVVHLFSGTWSCLRNRGKGGACKWSSDKRLFGEMG